MPRHCPFPTLEKKLSRKFGINIDQLLEHAKEKNPEELNSNMDFAAFILGKVNNLNIKIADLPNPELTPKQQRRLEANVSAIQSRREQAFGHNLMKNRECPLKNLLALANVINRHHYGNCLELAILAFGISFNEMMRLEGKPRSLAIIFFGGNEQSHFALAIGDGDEKVICDPWSGVVMFEENLIELQRQERQGGSVLSVAHVSESDIELIYPIDTRRHRAYNPYFELNVSTNAQNEIIANCQVINELSQGRTPARGSKTITVSNFTFREDELSARHFRYYLLNRDKRAIGEHAPVIDSLKGKIINPLERVTQKEAIIATTPPEKKNTNKRKVEESIDRDEVSFWNFSKLLSDESESDGKKRRIDESDTVPSNTKKPK